MLFVVFYRFFYLYVMLCNFMCFICMILLPSGVMNDDDDITYREKYRGIRSTAVRPLILSK